MVAVVAASHRLCTFISRLYRVKMQYTLNREITIATSCLVIAKSEMYFVFSEMEIECAGSRINMTGRYTYVSSWYVKVARLSAGSLNCCTGDEDTLVTYIYTSNVWYRLFYVYMYTRSLYNWCHEPLRSTKESWMVWSENLWTFLRRSDQTRQKRLAFRLKMIIIRGHWVDGASRLSFALAFIHDTRVFFMLK